MFGTGHEIAAAGTGFVTASTDGTTVATRAAKVTIWSATLGSPKSLKLAGVEPIVSAGPSGFAVAVSGATAEDLPQFYTFTTLGAPLCGPVKFADTAFVPGAMVATGTGYLVVSTGVVRVQELSPDCTPGSLFTIDSASGSDNVGIAAGSASVGVVWQRNAGITVTPMQRVFGPHYCD